MIHYSSVINAFRKELSRYFEQNKLDGKFLVEDGPEDVRPTVSVQRNGRIRWIDVESIQTDKEFVEELHSIIEWMQPVTPNLGAAAHWKNQPPVERIGRRPSWK